MTSGIGGAGGLTCDSCNFGAGGLAFGAGGFAFGAGGFALVVGASVSVSGGSAVASRAAARTSSPVAVGLAGARDAVAAVVSTAADGGSVLSGDGTGTDVVDAGEAGTECGFAFGVDGSNGGGAFFGVVGKSTLGGIGYKSLLLSHDIVKTCF